MSSGAAAEASSDLAAAMRPGRVHCYRVCGFLLTLSRPARLLCLSRLQVLDVHIVFGKPGGGPTSPGAVLSTGSITFHTVRQHLQLTPEAALELLRHHCKGQRAGPGAEAAAATAVIAVEQQLVYQLFEFGVSGIQLAAVNMQLLGAVEVDSDRGSERGGGRRSAAGEVPPPPSSADMGGAGRRTVLQPVKLGGTLKLHRITDVSAVSACGEDRHAAPPTNAQSEVCKCLAVEDFGGWPNFLRLIRTGSLFGCTLHPWFRNAALLCLTQTTIAGNVLEPFLKLLACLVLPCAGHRTHCSAVLAASRPHHCRPHTNPGHAPGRPARTAIRASWQHLRGSKRGRQHARPVSPPGCGSASWRQQRGPLPCSCCWQA